ncbi:MAG: methyltransferase domain-containing protein [Phycisphaerales bacterium]|nr:methyltransferase domain-containing protein [Phycisphaerales bacterium]
MPAPTSTPQRPTSAASTAYSQDQAEAYDDKRFTGPVGRRLHTFEWDILREALGRVDRSARIIEIGCGTGRLLLEARRAGYRVGGLDASPHMLEQLRRKITGGGEFEMIVGQAASVPMPDASFDFVYAIRLLNQTESPEYALRVVAEMHRLVRPGGYVLAEFVNAHRPRWGDNRRETTRLTPAQVIECGRAAGGEVITCRGAFLLSMQAYNRAPRFCLPIVSGLDRLLSRLLPRWCSRSYVLFRKRAAA